MEGVEGEGKIPRLKRERLTRKVLKGIETCDAEIEARPFVHAATEAATLFIFCHDHTMTVEVQLWA